MQQLKNTTMPTVLFDNYIAVSYTHLDVYKRQVFPEGTRCKNIDDLTEVQSFKEGTFKIATKSKCKIVPMAIMGRCV